MEQMQTYIKFARSLLPQFTQASAAILRDEYKAIRQREKASSEKTAYKVTVRQLESLVRLSEALARAHCDLEIKPAYVKEVCRLLRQSNINLTKKDVEFEERQAEMNVVAHEARAREEEEAA
jgi:DNA replication licensing factor MCM6